MQEQRRQAQRIGLATASRLAQMSRVTQDLPGGIRRVQPSGVPQRDASDSQTALIMAAQEAASKIAGNLGWRQAANTTARMHAMQTHIARSAGQSAPAANEYFETELVINDFPQAARYHVTHRDTIAHITERTGVPPLHVHLDWTALHGAVSWFWGIFVWSCCRALQACSC
jgi:ATP-dependent RNA helicase DDX46/PRP5